MMCKVVSASLGYNERIYGKGDDINVDTPDEVERLIGYKVIEKSLVETPELSSLLTTKNVVTEKKGRKPVKNASSTKKPSDGRKRK